MDRREFIRAGVQAAAASAMVSIPTGSSQAANVSAAKVTANDAATSTVLKEFTAEDHRRRLQNISICTRKIRTLPAKAPGDELSAGPVLL